MTMESWRLSKIEEELDRVEATEGPDPDFPPPPPDFGSMEWSKSRDQSPFGTLERPHSRDHSPFNTLDRPKSRDQSPFGTLERLKYAAGSGTIERGRSMTPSGTLERRHRSLTPSGTLERSHSFSNTIDNREVEEDIYSKIVVKKGYSKEDMEQEAIKHFTGKYESLGKVMLGAMSPKQETKLPHMGAHEEDTTLPTVFPEPIAPPTQLSSPTSPQLRSPTSPTTPRSPMTPTSPTSPTSPTIRRDVIRPRSKPPPLPPSVPQSPSSPPSTLSRPSSASNNSLRSSQRQCQRTPDMVVRRSHSQSSSQRTPLPQQQHHQQQLQQQQQQQACSNNSRKCCSASSSSTALTEADITQVEMFYRSHKTEVFVCQCMANLYEGTLRTTGSSSKSSDAQMRSVEIWNYVKPGIPVFVLDSGESRRNRKLSIMLSERGTGFPLWKETMSHLTHYRAEKPTFHTLRLNTDHNKMMALSFDDPVAANEFVHILQSIVSNPDDDVLNLSGKKKKKDTKKKPQKKYKPPNKADISSPCCFTHVTNLSSGDGTPRVAPTPPPPTRNSGSAPTSPVQSMTHLPLHRGVPRT